jgi:Protein of unknown function (DUF3179)
VWKSTVDGKVLHFRLAGINNQNFLMQDRETGSWWQQASGKAIAGALRGQSLELAPYDELTFGLWKQESPNGQILAAVAKDAKEYESNWEPEVQKLPTVIAFPNSGLQSRDVVMGIEVNSASRAYPLSTVLAHAPIQDRLGGLPIVLVAGPDGKSVRAFVSQLHGSDLELFLKGDSAWALVDSLSASEWNFQGCATAGSAAGQCLQPLPVLKDYWFDWRDYHPSTSIFRR